MYQVIPEQVLATQFCSTCKKYLSRAPTKSYRDGNVKCGRCVGGVKDDGVLSMYKDLVDDMMFPCVNRFEGCGMILRYQDVSAHETNCIGHEYPCPMCPKYQPNSLLFLINHYEMFHKNSILKRPKIAVDPRKIEECHYLYYSPVENLLFMIYYKFDADTYLSINACSVEKEYQNIKHKFSLVVDGVEVFNSISRACANFDNHSDAFTLSIKDYLKDDSDSIMCKFEFDIRGILKF